MEFVNHQFGRLELLVGSETLRSFRARHVVVVGVGGVGSFVVESLARSGIGTLTLIDHDEVCISNVNRQLQAFPDVVGRKKVDELLARVRRINPSINAFAYDEFYNQTNAANLFERIICTAGKSPDVVVDCIDTVDSKVNLIAHCVKQGFAVVSSMGAAGKIDPSHVRSGDISETRVDPLAKVVRSRLRALGITQGVRVVYSVESPRANAINLSEIDWQCSCVNTGKRKAACVPRRSARGTIAYMPSIFGLWLSSEVLKPWME